MQSSNELAQQGSLNHGPQRSKTAVFLHLRYLGVRCEDSLANP